MINMFAKSKQGNILIKTTNIYEFLYQTTTHKYLECRTSVSLFVQFLVFFCVWVKMIIYCLLKKIKEKFLELIAVIRILLQNFVLKPKLFMRENKSLSFGAILTQLEILESFFEHFSSTSSVSCALFKPQFDNFMSFYSIKAVKNKKALKDDPRGSNFKILGLVSASLGFFKLKLNSL